MAEKRMISKSISVSEKVNTLPDVFDMLLFTWLIPHSDDFGRLTGSPAKVKALVIPMLDKSIRDVENALAALHAAEVIIWYQVEGDKYIQIVNFDKHQQGLHKRTKSKFPEHDGNSEEVPGSSGNVLEIPPELNRTELNRTELNKDICRVTPDDLPEQAPKESIPFAEIVAYLNQIAGTNYRHTTKATQSHIKARWKEGHRSEQFKIVIDKKCAEWIGSELEQYLRPETLFGTKFESYLNQKTVIKGGGYGGKYGPHNGRSQDADRRAADKDADLYIGTPSNL